MTPATDSWDKWRSHVLAELKRTNESIMLLTGAMTGLHIEVAKLQVKSGVWGVIGGMIPVLIMLGINKLK